jgi:hypothetical protein
MDDRSPQKPPLLPLKELLFLGFCALLLLFSRVALQLKLKIPGHSMLFTSFFLLLARGCVRFRLAASTTALLAGLLGMILGLGKGGPLLLLKFLLPALVIDGMAMLLPSLFLSPLLCALVAALAASTRFFNTWFIDRLLGLEPDIILTHALIQTAGGVAFALIGGFMVPPVLHRLAAYGLIQPPSRGK